MKVEKITQLAYKKHLEIQDLFMNLVSGIKVKGKFKFLYPNQLVDLSNFYRIVYNRNWRKARKMIKNMDSKLAYIIPDLIFNFVVNSC